jgi:hypothetical protein
VSQITIKRCGWWGSIPESLLTDQRLGHAAVRLGAWLAMRQDGWRVRKQHVRTVLGLGESVWDRACSELKQAGYLVIVPLRAGGRFIGQDYTFDPSPDIPDSPEAVPPPTVNTGGGGTGGGSTGAGRTAHLTSTSVTSTNKTNTTTTTNAAILIWPPCLAQGQQAPCLAAMAGLSVEQQQMLLDELSGQTKPVPNPVGWLRHLTKISNSGAFQADLAAQVRVDREARTRAGVQMKEAAQVVVRPPTAEERAKLESLRGRNLVQRL